VLDILTVRANNFK